LVDNLDVFVAVLVSSPVPAEVVREVRIILERWQPPETTLTRNTADLVFEQAERCDELISVPH